MEPGFKPHGPVKVGGVVLAATPIEYNTNRRVISLEVCNTGDRPVQVGSHFHFFEVNRALKFDRAKAFGFHLNIPSTTAVRFEPGDHRTVELVSYGGKQRVIGFNGLVEGFTGLEDSPTYYPTRERALHHMCVRGFAHGEVTPSEAAACDHTKSNTPNHEKK